MRVLFGFLLGASWAVYLGGLLVMEFVWRPVQRHLPPAQTGVVCQKMGRMYRWLSLGALGIVALTCFAWHGVASPTYGAAGAHSVAQGGLPAVGWAAWLGLASLVILASLVFGMGLALHPTSHKRAAASVDTEGAAANRERRLRAIRFMNIALRAELVIALGATAVAALPGHVGAWWGS